VPVTALIVVLAGIRWPWGLPVGLAASTVALWFEKQIMRTQSR